MAIFERDLGHFYTLMTIDAEGKITLLYFPTNKIDQEANTTL